MSTNTWTAEPGQFAKRITLKDIPGFFSKQLVIGAGTKALVVSDGIHLGVVGQGTYTLQSFTEKLKFWKSPKQIDVLLVPENDLPIDFRVDKIPTAEELLVAVNLDMVVQIQDVAIFAHNLLGSRDGYSIAEITDIIRPIIGQALKETIRQVSIASLTSPDVRPVLVTGIQESAKPSLARYGITCEDIRAVDIANEKYDQQRQKTGEIWLLEQSTQQERELGKVLDAETLMKIERQEREVELNVLAENVGLDAEESEVTLKLRRNEIRKNMRDAVSSDLFDQARTKEEFRAFLLEIDKLKMIREDERHELETLYESKKDDRQAARELIVRKLELQRNAELDQLSMEIAYTGKRKTLQYEIELAKMVDDEGARSWRETLQREIEQSEHDYLEAAKLLERQHELNSKQMKFLRTEEWEQLLQKQKTTRLAGEIQEEEAAREVRVARIKNEYEVEQERRKHVLQLEMQHDQMKLLQEMEIMNRERDEFESVLLLKTESQRHQQQIEILNTKAAMSVEALIATSDTANAELLANVQISKNESRAQVAIREEAAARERELQEQRVRDAQASNATTLDTIQKITSQAFGAMGQVAGHPSVLPGYGSSTDPNVPRVAVCGGCRAENPPSARFCSQCGKDL